MTLLMVPQSVCISEGPFTSGPWAFIRLFTSMFHHFMKTQAVGSREGSLTLQTPVLGAIISTLKQKMLYTYNKKNTFEEMCLFIKNCLLINIERITRLLSNKSAASQANSKDPYFSFEENRAPTKVHKKQ